MTTFIIILAALGTLVFLMKEYGWSDLTGNTRNDLVFEQRNKKYGAYEIRQKYSNRLVIAFFGAIAFISIAAVSPKVFLKADGKDKNPVKENGGDYIVETFENKPKEKEKEIEKIPENKPKTNEAAPKAPDVSTTAQTTPKASDKPVLNDTTQVNKNAVVSTTNHKGTDTTSTAQVIPGKGGKGTCSDCDTTTREIKKTILEAAEVDREAKFENYASFIRKHLRIPEGAKGGKVYMSFVVDTEGNVTQARVKKGVDPIMDAEVKRVISMMPKWTPAIKDGEKVAVRMVLPVNIVLN